MSRPNPDALDKDEGTLAEQGYKQELDRNWSVLHNFGVSFSIIVWLYHLGRALLMHPRA